MLIGLSLSAAIFLLGMAWYWFGLREWVFSGRGPVVRHSSEGGIAGIILLIPAIIPGLLFGWVAHRLPKVLKLRCRKCAWQEGYRIGRDGRVTAMSAFPLRAPHARARAADQTNLAFDAISPQPAPAPTARIAPAGATALDQVVDDDPVSAAKAWVYAEIAAGRSPEDVAADLMAQGWAYDNAEALAEHGRRATRHMRP
jgi:hypothetical protein